MSQIWSMIAKRLALGLLTLLIVSILIFLATELLPGDFAEEFLGQSATPETVAAIRRERHHLRTLQNYRMETAMRDEFCRETET